MSWKIKSYKMRAYKYIGGKAIAGNLMALLPVPLQVRDHRAIRQAMKLGYMLMKANMNVCTETGHFSGMFWKTASMNIFV